MKPLIIALDVETEREALSIVRRTRRHADIYKVGPPLLLRAGSSVIQKIRGLGKRVFLDLKFHDIPNTMRRSIEEANRWGIYSATVHTSAGLPALRTVAGLKRRPRLWGVTVLTSLSETDLNGVGVSRSPRTQVPLLAKLARKGGLDGVVASVNETAALRRLVGSRFEIITPGIRRATDAIGDQKRVATPAVARRAGATAFVVGRPIIDARDPAEAAADLLNDWARAKSTKG